MPVDLQTESAIRDAFDSSMDSVPTLWHRQLEFKQIRNEIVVLLMFSKLGHSWDESEIEEAKRQADTITVRSLQSLARCGFDVATTRSAYIRGKYKARCLSHLMAAAVFNITKAPEGIEHATT
jgi:hypothetical protein